MRIALWGFGDYGKALYATVNQSYRDLYQVVAVFDRAHETMADAPVDGVRVENPDALLGRFQEGAFESVLIGTLGTHVYLEMAEKLKAWGIPVVHLADCAELVAAEDFDSCIEAEIQLDDEGYCLAECLGIDCFVDRHGTQELLVFHDGRGRVVRNMWDDSDLANDPGLLNFAMRVDAEPIARVDLEGAYCAAARFWGKNYWHFTFQHLDQIAVMERAGFTGVYLLPQTPFSRELVELAGISVNRVLWTSDMQEGVAYRFEKVLFVYPDNYSFRGNVSASPLLRVASRIESNAVDGMDIDGYPKKLFVKRVGTRQLEGVQKSLDEHGFVTIVPDNLTVSEQIRFFHAANIVLAPHGANSTNSIYMRPGSVFIETFGRAWGFPMCVEALLAKGVRYLSVVEDLNRSDQNADRNANYRVSNTLLEMAISNAVRLAED